MSGDAATATSDRLDRRDVVGTVTGFMDSEEGHGLWVVIKGPNGVVVVPMGAVEFADEVTETAPDNGRAAGAILVISLRREKDARRAEPQSSPCASN